MPFNLKHDGNKSYNIDYQYTVNTKRTKGKEKEGVWNLLAQIFEKNELKKYLKDLERNWGVNLIDSKINHYNWDEVEELTDLECCCKTRNIVEKSIISEYIQKADNSDISFNANLEILRSIIILDIIRYKGINNKDYLEYSNEILKKSIKYEYYDYAVIVLKRLLNYSISHNNEKATTRYIDLIKQYEIKKNNIDLSKNILISIQNNIIKKPYFNLFKKKCLDDINKLNLLKNDTNSKKIKYYYLIARHSYISNLNDLNKFIRSAKILYDFVNTNSIIKNKSTFFNAQINYAYALIFCGYFNLSEKLIINIDNKNLNKYNNIVLLYISQLSSFYVNKYKYIDILSNREITDYKSIGITHYINKLILLESSYLFKTKKYKSAKDILNKINFISEKDNSLILHNKLLLIMINIENEDYDQSDYLIEAFRKAIERNKLIIDNYKRWILIKAFLIRLKRFSYNFSVFRNKKNEKFNELQKIISVKSWGYSSVEITTFHFWISSKLEGKY